MVGPRCAVQKSPGLLGERACGGAGRGPTRPALTPYPVGSGHRTGERRHPPGPRKDPGKNLEFKSNPGSHRLRITDETVHA